MLHVIDLSIEYLEFDEEYNPYKLLGVTTTKKVFVGFVSIIGYIIGYAVFYKLIENWVVRKMYSEKILKINIENLNRILLKFLNF